MRLALDEIYAKSDAFVSTTEDVGFTLVAANKRGRDAVQRVIDAQHPDKVVCIDWRDAGEGWPDPWLGFSFPTPDEKPFAAAIRAEGARVFHQDQHGAVSYLLPVA